MQVKLINIDGAELAMWYEDWTLLTRPTFDLANTDTRCVYQLEIGGTRHNLETSINLNEAISKLITEGFHDDTCI